MKIFSRTAKFTPTTIMMTPEEESALFEKLREGDKKALERLFKYYYSTLCNFALPIVRQPDLAEELVADVFFVIWRDREHLQVLNLKAYLFRAVRNKALEVLRTESKHLHVDVEQVELPPSHTTPESDLLYHELNSRYQHAYEALPDKCKLIFKLNRIDGLTYQQISEVLEISVKTVENQMSNALRLIRSDIARYQLKKIT